MRTINLYYPDLASKKLGNKLAIRDEFQRNHLKVIKAGYLDYKYVCRDGAGYKAEIVLKTIDKKEGALFEIKEIEVEALPKSFVRLLVPFIRPARLEVALDQVTQIGLLQEVGLYFADFSRQTTKEVSANKLDRFAKLLLTAFSQSGAVILPALKSYETLEEGVQDWQQDLLPAQRRDSSFVWLDFAGEQYSAGRLSGILNLAEKSGSAVTLVVGPEGGFSKNERLLLESLPDQVSLRLPTPTLTTETAATVITALAASCVGASD